MVQRRTYPIPDSISHFGFDWSMAEWVGRVAPSRADGLLRWVGRVAPSAPMSTILKETQLARDGATGPTHPKCCIPNGRGKQELARRK